MVKRGRLGVVFQIGIRANFQEDIHSGSVAEDGGIMYWCTAVFIAHIDIELETLQALPDERISMPHHKKM